MTLELLLDAVERLFDTLVAGAHGHGVFLDLFEEAREEAALILAALHAVHGGYHLNEQAADFARVLSSDVLQRLGRDRGGLLLHGRTVVGNDLALVEVDLFGKRLDLRLFLGSQTLHLGENLLGRDGKLLLLRGSRLIFGHTVKY